MITHQPLTTAPLGKPLELIKVMAPDLAIRLSRMGLFEGSYLTRMEQEVQMQPVRIRGPKGESVLGGGMAMKTVVHMDDGRKYPLAEMKKGEKGHIEGLSGGTKHAENMKVLGLFENTEVEILRKLPPMEYTTLIEGEKRVRLSEGMATKIWGRMEEETLQFVSARTGVPFVVEKILGGSKSCCMLNEFRIQPGTTISLEHIAMAQSLKIGVRNPIVISSHDGLRLFLEPHHAEQILVRAADPSK